LFSLSDLNDLLGLLVQAQSGSEGSSEFGSKELSSSGGVLVEVSSKDSSLLLVEDGKVSGDVLSDGFNFSEFGGAT
jgi:hypothetical protein